MDLENSVRRVTDPAEVDRELQIHLEFEAQERLERGMSADEAHYAAKRDLGNQTGFVKPFTRCVRFLSSRTGVKTRSRASAHCGAILDSPWSPCCHWR